MFKGCVREKFKKDCFHIKKLFLLRGPISADFDYIKLLLRRKNHGILILATDFTDFSP